MASRDSGRKIVSITAAPGWAALFEDADDPLGERRAVTLAAWALVEDAAQARQLVGLVQKPVDAETPAGSFLFADENEGFAGYTNRGLLTRGA